MTVIEQFAKHLSTSSPNTVAAYTADLRRILEHLPGTTLDSASAAALQRALSLSVAGARPSTAMRRYQAARRFCAWRRPDVQLEAPTD